MQILLFLYPNLAKKDKQNMGIYHCWGQSQQQKPINPPQSQPSPNYQPVHSSRLNASQPHDDPLREGHSLIAGLLDLYKGLPSAKQAVKVPNHVKLTPLAQATLQLIKSAPDNQQNPRIPPLTQQIYYMKGCKATYQGDFKEGQPHGFGIAHFKDGSFYYGGFEEGNASGVGIYIFKDGSIYEGRVSDKFFNGFGSICYQHNRMKFVGYFADGKPHGKGEQIYQDGQCFAGEYRNGIKQGNGVYVWKTGQVYYGTFHNGLMEGEGVIKKDTKVVFEGNFKLGQRVGPGLIIGQTASYQGWFQNDLLEGPGSILWEDGTIWQGQFQKSNFTGTGKIYQTNDDIYEVEWKNNEIIAHGNPYKSDHQVQKKNQLKLKHRVKVRQIK